MKQINLIALSIATLLSANLTFTMQNKKKNVHFRIVNSSPRAIDSYSPVNSRTSPFDYEDNNGKITRAEEENEQYFNSLLIKPVNKVASSSKKINTKSTSSVDSLLFFDFENQNGEIITAENDIQTMHNFSDTDTYLKRQSEIEKMRNFSKNLSQKKYFQK